ncbi:MAG: hypothetical protein ABS56_12735 [Lautropia sp. SCN 69-89]|nr:MAG: hypothetical protein ABS56_12735 [Lautropia sp. SCN 69-89]
MSEILQAALAAKSLTIAEWCHVRRVGRTRAFEEIQSGRLRTYKVGRRRYISAEADTQWQRDREAESAMEVA